MAAARSITATGTRTFQSFRPATGTSATFTALADADGADTADAGEEPDAGDRGCRRHRARTRRYGSSRLCIALQPLQIAAHLRGVLVAQIAVFLQCLGDDVFQLGRQVRVQS